MAKKKKTGVQPDQVGEPVVEAIGEVAPVTDEAQSEAAGEIETPPASAPVDIPYEKTDTEGKTATDYKPTSGETVLVYSKWQHDLRYETPYGPAIIQGLSSSKIIGALFMTSDVEVEKWNYVASIYGATRMFRNHFVFMAKDVSSGNAHAREVASEKTGLEPIDPKNPGGIIKTDEG